MRQRFLKTSICAGLLALSLAACSESGTDEAMEASADSASYEAAAADAEMAADAVAEASGGSAAAGPVGELGALPVSMPKLAYTYDFSYRLPGEEIGKLQRRHADLCEQQGPASCQILGMTKNGETDDYVTGELQLAVATRHARAFGALLEDEAEDSGAEQLAAEISSEELSKQIVDTEAHLRARTELRDRLLEVLRTRKGKVSELVEAERSVAEVNREIDQARSWLKEMQGRVAFSKVTVRYESGAAPASDFLDPVRGALGSLGSIFGMMAAAAILIGAVGGPIALVVWIIARTRRRFAPVAQATEA